MLKLARKELKANRVIKAASLPSVSPSVCSANRLTADSSIISNVPIGHSEPSVDIMCDESMDIVMITNENGRKRQLADKDGFVKPHKPVAQQSQSY